MRQIRSSIFILACSIFLFSSKDNNYKWKMELPPDSGRFPEKWVQGKWPMGIKPVVALNGNLYMIGSNKTWISSDGINWKAYPKTDWNERHGTSITFFKGKLWMMGGMKSWGRFLNDIWSSDDGLTWQLVKAHAEWSERRGHRVLAFNNKLWLYGGALSSGRDDQLPTELLNDIWNSEDGVNWKLVSKQAGWNPGQPEIVQLKNKLYMVGADKDPRIWTSDNGYNWTSLINKSSWNPRSNFGLLEYDNKLWLFGGTGHNDVWCTSNGKDWQQLFSSAPWSTRASEHCISFSNKLWIFSGKTGREDSWSGEVWTMSK